MGSNAPARARSVTVEAREIRCQAGMQLRDPGRELAQAMCFPERPRPGRQHPLEHLLVGLLQVKGRIVELPGARGQQRLHHLQMLLRA